MLTTVGQLDVLLDYWIIGLLDYWIIGLLDCWIIGILDFRKNRNVRLELELGTLTCSYFPNTAI